MRKMCICIGEVLSDWLIFLTNICMSVYFHTNAMVWLKTVRRYMQDS